MRLLRATVKVLIIPSADGYDYTHAMAYPHDWDEDRVRAEYETALMKSQTGDYWGWPEIEEALLDRGFMDTTWVHAGPNWDETL